MLNHSFWRLSLALSLTCAALSPLFAQEPPASTNNTPDVLREQSIYIPYEKLRRTFEREGRGVYLPYDKFQELWKAARDAQPVVPKVEPPFKAIITEIDNEAQVRDDVLHVTATLKIDLLGQGWIEVPLRLADAALLSATVGDQPARVVTDEQGGHKLLWNRTEADASQIQLKLQYARSITKAPAQNSVEFQAPLAPVNRWRIRVPQAGVKVNVHPLLAATEVPAGAEPAAAPGAPDNGGAEPPLPTETVVLAFLGAAPSVRIDWTPRAEGATGLDALVSVQAEQEVTINEGVARTRVRLNYQISRAELAELKIEVPGDQKVVNVADANLRQWNVEPSGSNQTITVGLFQPARDQQALVIELEQFQQGDAAIVSVPSVQAVGVGRQRGVVLVRLADVLRGEPVRRTGLSQVDREEIPAALREQPWAFSYRYATLPFDLALQVQKVEPRVQIDQLVEAFLEPQSLTLSLFARYDVQRAGIFELQLELPAGFEVVQVIGHEAAGAVAAVVDTHTVDNSDPAHPKLKVNLAAKAQGPTGLRVELLRRLSDDNLLSPTNQSSPIALVPPRAGGPWIARSNGRLVVYAPESLRVEIAQLDGLRNISFEEAYKDTASLRGERFPELRPVQAMAFSEAAAAAQLAVQRRQPYVTAQQLLEVRIEPGVMKCTATFFYNIAYSGVKALRIDLPAAIAGDVRNNQTETLRESALAEQDGYVGWALVPVGKTELLGETQVKLSWETPIADLGLGKSVPLHVPRLIPRDVNRQDGQIVLVKSETIDVQPQGVPQGLDPIDPEHNLMRKIHVPDAAAALEFQDNDWDLTLVATRYELQPLTQTSIEQAVLRQVITRSDRVSVQALYRMRSNQQRLKLQLPAEAQLDTDPLRINGRRTTLERGDDDRSYFVPLVGMTANEPFLLELRYTTSGNGTRLTYPGFPDEPAVQKVNLLAYVPQERSLLGHAGPWTDELVWVRGNLATQQPVPRVNADELLGQLTQGINLAGNPAEEFPVDGRPLLFSTLRPPDPDAKTPAQDAGALRLNTFSTRWLHALVFGVVTLLGVLLLRRPITERFVVACVLLAILVLLGVFLPTFTRAIVNQILLLAVLLVLLLWLAAFLLRDLPRLSSGMLQRRKAAETTSEAELAASAVPSSPAGAVETSEARVEQDGGSRHES